MRDLFLVYDTEANGFYEDGSIMWCLVAKELKTQQQWEWGGPDGLASHRDQIRALFQQAKVLVCHNQIKHDLPQLYKLGIIKPDDWWEAKIIDTYTCSTLFNPDRAYVKGAKAGPHSLEAWGVRAGILKPQQEQWLVWEDSMLHRCREDVAINEWVFNQLVAESKEDEWDWITAMDVEHKQAFIIAQQERVGWHFFHDKAAQHIATLDAGVAEIDKLCLPLMPQKMTHFSPIRKLFKKNGHYTKQVCDWFNVDEKDSLLPIPPVANSVTDDMPGALRNISDEEGLVARIGWEAPNPNSDDQLKNFLLTQGWVPDEYTPTGLPKLTEESLNTVTGDLGKKLAHRKVLSARRSQLSNIKKPEEKGWLSMVRPDGRISAVCFPCGTPTGRATHKGIVNVPRVTTYFGREMREVFGVAEGRRQLGYDASGLELRCLANRMQDPEYINTVLHGDVHTANMEAAGLDSRDDAKTFIYALIYGAGDLKIGRIVGGNSTTGKELRYKFFDAIPALGELMNRTKLIAKRGYLRGADGRKLFVRSDHSSLNTLLQSDGAVVMKYAMIFLDEWLAAEGFKYPARLLADIYLNSESTMKVGDIHDEGQLDVAKEIVSDAVYFVGSKKDAEKWSPDERIWSAPSLIEGDKEDGKWERVYCRPGELAIHAIRQAGDALNFVCPLDGEYKIGASWADTH